MYVLLYQTLYNLSKIKIKCCQIGLQNGNMWLFIVINYSKYCNNFKILFFLKGTIIIVIMQLKSV